MISGTNGKTTTTKMVVELLESQGLKVFTNRTGSNFTRGVAAALLGEVDTKGKLDADIAVLELDEAHAVHFVKNIRPRYSLLLNVMRDQLDRFGEIDITARLLHKIAKATTDGVVINQDDPRLASPDFLTNLATPVRSFGVSPQLKKLFPSDDELHGSEPAAPLPEMLTTDSVMLSAIKRNGAKIAFGGKDHKVKLKVKGTYNILNAAAAIALCRFILGDKLDEAKMLTRLEAMSPAFGRGEVITIGGQPLELVLVKNPSGFRLSLASFDPSGYQTMIAINDNYADGRDMSWLWDVNFESLRAGVAEVSGIRAYDMALRLQYDEIAVTHVSQNLTEGLQHFIADAADQPKRIYCTYTAMLALRDELAKLAEIEKAL